MAEAELFGAAALEKPCTLQWTHGDEIRHITSLDLPSTNN